MSLDDIKNFGYYESLCAETFFIPVPDHETWSEYFFQDEEHDDEAHEHDADEIYHYLELAREWDQDDKPYYAYEDEELVALEVIANDMTNNYLDLTSKPIPDDHFYNGAYDERTDDYNLFIPSEEEEDEVLGLHDRNFFEFNYLPAYDPDGEKLARIQNLDEKQLYIERVQTLEQEKSVIIKELKRLEDALTNESTQQSEGTQQNIFG